MRWIKDWKSPEKADCSELKNLTRECEWYQDYAYLIDPQTNIRDSLMFNCMFQMHTQEVKNLIWLKYYQLALLLERPDTFAIVHDNADCIKRTLT